MQPADGPAAVETNDPMALFRRWHRDARDGSPAAHASAMCVATVGADGIPAARFVDLKVARDDGFVFCTSHASPKARQIEANPAVALTFWWDHVGRQVRVVGRAVRIAQEEADAFFAERSRDAQLASCAYDQSAPLLNADAHRARIRDLRARYEGSAIPRPAHWGGYLVRPHRLEFLQFHDSRAHDRLLYERTGEGWEITRLQP